MNGIREAVLGVFDTEEDMIKTAVSTVGLPTEPLDLLYGVRRSLIEPILAGLPALPALPGLEELPTLPKEAPGPGLEEVVRPPPPTPAPARREIYTIPHIR